jgi:Domain of unknown function (DUF4112)
VQLHVHRRRKKRLSATHDVDAILRRLERLAKFLDAAIVIPGTRFRFGADAILGLVPGGGDVVGAALSGYIVYAAWKLGLPASALLRMAANVAVDTTFGAVPVAGDAFDVYFKANLRNMEVIRRHLRDRPR